MRILGVPIDQISFEYLDQLAADETPESRTHEYRGELASDEKQRLAKTASAFANTVGGVIIFGVQQAGGDSLSVGGLRGFSLDAAKRRIQQTLASQVEPAIAGLAFTLVDAPRRLPVLLVGIPQSLQAPHALLARDGSAIRSYWRRRDGMKYAMTTAELRESFLSADAWTHEAEEFRNARIEGAFGHEPRLGYRANPKDGPVFVHLLPLGRLRARFEFPTDLSKPDVKFFNDRRGWRERAKPGRLGYGRANSVRGSAVAPALQERRDRSVFPPVRAPGRGPAGHVANRGRIG